MVGKQTSLIILAAVFISSARLAAEEQYTRERYEVIVDRSPFGEDTLNTADLEAVNSAKEAADAAAASKAAERELRLCFLLESESGDVRALSLIHISEPTRLWSGSRMPSSA